MSAISIPPSGQWWPWDGEWSTFTMGVGTPVYNLSVLFSTSLPVHYLIWSPTTTNSTSWTGLDTANITIDNYLGYDFDAIYGYDVVSLDLNNGSGALSANRQLIGLAQSNQYQLDGFFSYLGLYPQENSSEALPGLLKELKDEGSIPSLSWGYNAGSWRRRFNGSLTLGGYDEAKIASTGVSYAMTDDPTHFLTANLTSISIASTSNATETVLSSPISVNIDSNLPFIWLPESVCDSFAKRLNLTYNATAGIYQISSNSAQALLNESTTFTFSLAGASGSSQSPVDVVFDYADLYWDFTTGVVNNSAVDVLWFPLKNSTNESEYVLGRMFLQNAYVIADFERRNFTVAPRAWTDATALIDIYPISNSSSTNGTSTGNSTGTGTGSSSTSTPSSTAHSSLPGGAIAGIVIGVVALIALLSLLFFFFLRRRRTRRAASLPAQSISGSTAGYDTEEVMSFQKPELDNRHPLSGGGYWNGREMPGDEPRHEMQDGREMAEMAAEERPVEVDAGVRHELAA